VQCVILAGGLGTRIRSVSTEVPKCLISVAGKPFIAWQLDWLRDQGITEIVLCIGHLGSQVREFVGDGEAFGLRVTYVDEGESLRGTAGALRMALDADVLAPWFFVLYGDSYLRVPVKEVAKKFLKMGVSALMTVFQNAGKWEESNVIFNGEIVEKYEKNSIAPPEDMVYVDYGLLVLKREIIRNRVGSTSISDLAPILNSLSLEGSMAGFEATERFFEIGTPEGLDALEEHLSQSKN